MAKVIARPPASGLYEEDSALWAARQAALLRDGRFDELDLDNLIEEVEDLSRRKRDTVASQVETILEDLLKLDLSSAAPPKDGWLVTGDRRRARLARRRCDRNSRRDCRRSTTEAATSPHRYSRPRAPTTDGCRGPAPTRSPRSSRRAGSRPPSMASTASRPEMLLIPCPWRGAREETESRGDGAKVARGSHGRRSGSSGATI